jgi:hypothetical protein
MDQQHGVLELILRECVTELRDSVLAAFPDASSVDPLPLLQHPLSNGASASATATAASPVDSSTPTSLADRQNQVLAKRVHAITGGLKTRLSFLNFLLTNSALSLTLEQLTTMWQNLCLTPCYAVEADLFCSMLSKSLSVKTEMQRYFDHSVAQQFFANFLCGDSAVFLTSPVAFDLFTMFFLDLNARAGYLTYSVETPTKFMVTTANELIGWPMLWSLALKRNCSAAVWAPASALLVRATVQLATPLAESQASKGAQSLAAGFIDRCYAVMAAGAVPQTVEASLHLIRLLVQDGSGLDALSAQSKGGSSRASELLEVQAALKPGPGAANGDA